MDEFFDRYGYDGNLVAIYDDALDTIAQETGATIELSGDVEGRSVEEIIRKRMDLTVNVLIRGKQGFSVFIPVGSKYYPSDKKGYFIVCGQRYAFVSMDQAIYSYPVIKKMGGKIYCVYSYTEKGFSRYLKLEMDKEKFFQVGFMGQKISLQAFLKQLCFAFGKDIIDQVFTAFHRACTTCSKYYPDDKFILSYTSMVDSKFEKAEPDDIWVKVKHYFSYEEIINVLAYMAIKLVRYNIDKRIDDVDDESFKTVQTAGTTMLNMFYRCAKKEQFNPLAMSKLRSNMQEMFLNGIVPNFVGSKKDGVTQELECGTTVSMLSHIRRLRVFMSEDEAPYRVREYNSNHRGYTCMFETSDSKAAGLNKYLASSCVLSRETKNFKLFDETSFNEAGAPTFLNGKMVGYTTLADSLVEHLFASKGLEDTWSIYKREGTLCIHTVAGRLTRPMYCRGRTIFVDMGEYISYHKILQEIYPQSMMGLSALLTTFPHMSPGPRNNYQCSMNKQAISWCPSKFGSTSHEEKLLVSPNVPYVMTDGAKNYLSRFLDFGHTNVVVAVMSDMYNNEDAIIINEGAVRRGLFANIRIINERVYLKTISSGRNSDIQQVPHKIISGIKLFARMCYTTKSPDLLYRRGQYIKEDGDELQYTQTGTIKPWNILSKGMAYQTAIDRTKISPKQEYKYNELHEAVTFAHNNNMGANGRNMDHVYSEISSFKFRLPEIGDKFATDVSQKGVCALLRKESDMIQLPDGTIPHVIINPHGFPSRMTVGTLFNLAIGKYMCTQDKYNDVLIKHLHELDPIISRYTLQRSVNASAFRDMDDLEELMKTQDKGGSVYNPEVGEWTRKDVHYGILPYLALKHQIDEKSAASHVGPTTLLTGQPVSGRKNGGGFALGEMEVNALIAYNARAILRQRMFEGTDKVTVNHCKRCKIFAFVQDRCPICDGLPRKFDTRIPIVTLKNLLMCMGIDAKVETS